MQECALRIWVCIVEAEQNLLEPFLQGKFRFWGHNEFIILQLKKENSDCLHGMELDLGFDIYCQGCYQKAYRSEENIMREESNVGEKALYFILGAMIGAATALLLAPRSGVETRKLIATKAREGADMIASRTKTVVGKTSEFVERGKELLQQQRDQLSAALEAGKQAYREEKDKV
jgi:gas vesicle protein